MLDPNNHKKIVFNENSDYEEGNNPFEEEMNKGNSSENDDNQVYRQISINVTPDKLRKKKRKRQDSNEDFDDLGTPSPLKPRDGSSSGADSEIEERPIENDEAKMTADWGENTPP